nr:UDP-glycosyltransferase 91C1-like [Populus alba]
MAVNLHVVMVPWSAFSHIMPFFQLSIALAKARTKISFISTPKSIQRLPKILPNLIPLIDLQPFKQFVSNRSADWIIADVIVHWVVEIAQAHDVSLKVFSPCSASTAAFMWPLHYLVGDGQKRFQSSPESLTKPPEWFDFPSSIAFKLHEATGFQAGFYGDNASGISDAERTAKILNVGQALAIRTCNEFEGATVNDESWRKMFIWLGEQKPNSVVFVGFGSFIERTSNKGIVCMRWKPQMETLWHPSFGGSLFHSVWGSCLLPFPIDQPLYARLLVEKDLAVEVDRNGDESFSRDAIANAMLLRLTSAIITLLALPPTVWFYCISFPLCMYFGTD